MRGQRWSDEWLLSSRGVLVFPSPFDEVKDASLNHRPFTDPHKNPFCWTVGLHLAARSQSFKVFFHISLCCCLQKPVNRENHCIGTSVLSFYDTGISALGTFHCSGTGQTSTGVQRWQIQPIGLDWETPVCLRSRWTQWIRVETNEAKRIVCGVQRKQSRSGKGYK